MIKHQLNLKGFDFQELLTAEGLQKLDNRFLTVLQSANAQYYAQILDYRQNPQFAAPEIISQLLIDCAIILEAFLAQFFDIEEPAARLQAQTLSHQPIFAFKTYYVMKQARRAKSSAMKFLELNQLIENEILSKRLDFGDPQLAIARLGLDCLANAEASQELMVILVEWCVAAMTTEEGRLHTHDWEMFHLPKRLDFENLIDVQPVSGDPLGRLQSVIQRYRDGFELTDPRMSQRQVMAEVDYCVYCHGNQGDFCSKGFPIKKK